MEERNAYIELYFRMGLTQAEILGLLSYRHMIYVSDRQLRRILRQLCLVRRKNYTDLSAVAEYIQHQLNASGQMHGYRWMYSKCLHEGFVVRKEDVRLLLQVLDPEGVALRQKRKLKRRTYFAKGPNFIWHMDGYDKLKPYGICIHGCIDGYSRKIMWLRAYNTNNNPIVIAGYFATTVSEIGGSPCIVRADMGTENTAVADMQIFFRRGGTDQYLDRCFMYGKSTSNQRIESWWSILRREASQFWMNLFSELADDGLFDGSAVDKNLIQFCFMHIIQSELDSVALVWESHVIRPTQNSVMPSGRPFTLYNLPEMYGTRNYLCTVSSEDVDISLESCELSRTCVCSDEEMYLICKMYQNENNYETPLTAREAVELYTNLRTQIYLDLGNDHFH